MAGRRECRNAKDADDKPPKSKAKEKTHHRAHLEAHERVLHAEHVLARVLRHLVEELADQPLLLHELDVGQKVGRELDRLVEAVLAALIIFSFFFGRRRFFFFNPGAGALFVVLFLFVVG
jgi:hypothetical protein